MTKNEKEKKEKKNNSFFFNGSDKLNQKHVDVSNKKPRPVTCLLVVSRL